MELNDPQLELILVRSCIGVSKLYFALRTCPLSGFQDAEEIFDSAVRDVLDHIVTGGNPGFGEIQARIATLPIKYGGLGVLTVQDCKNYAFLASALQTEELQKSMIQDERLVRRSELELALQTYTDFVGECDDLLKVQESVPLVKVMKNLADKYFGALTKNIATEFSMDARQTALWKCLQVPHSQDFLYTLPIAGLGQVMPPREYRAVLGYRLMVPMFEEGKLCHGCNKVEMDRYGDHALNCRFDPGIKFRHDFVRDGLVDIMRRAGIAVKREAGVGVQKEGCDVILRPADILAYNWLNGKNTCIDLSGCSPLNGMDRGTFDPNKVLMNLVKNKYEKHERACQDAGLEFIPFGFTVFGGLCDEAIELMKRVGKIIRQHFICFKSSCFALHRLGFFIQKGISAQIVSRLPINFVFD